jgi:IS5 family transposase
MLIDRYSKEDIFTRVPRMAGRIDPVLRHLDQLLDDDELYQQVRHGARVAFVDHYRHSAD